MADSGLGSLDHILGLHIRLAHGAVQRHFADHFAEIGLTQKQVSVLWLVEAQPGIAQTDLAQRLQMDRATTMAIVHALEKRDLLLRTRSGDDARKIALRLSDDGVATLASARTAIESHETWLRDRFSDREAETLIDLLRRIHG